MNIAPKEAVLAVSRQRNSNGQLSLPTEERVEAQEQEQGGQTMLTWQQKALATPSKPKTEKSPSVGSGAASYCSLEDGDKAAGKVVSDYLTSFDNHYFSVST